MCRSNTETDEAQTPQQRYLPGIGVAQLVVSRRNGKALRLYENDDSDRPSEHSPAHDEIARSEAETSWLVIEEPVHAREPAQRAPANPFRRSRFRRACSAS